MSKRSFCKTVMVVYFLILSIAVSAYADNGWVNINGNVSYKGRPVCAMVLANGQYAFSCSEDGTFNFDVPLDHNGNITVQSFCSGHEPYRKTIDPSQATGIFIDMIDSSSANDLEINYSIRARNRKRCVISGNVSYNGSPVCAMVLANGHYTFTCSGNGGFTIDAPYDSSGRVTFYAFCAGKQPYKVVLESNEISFIDDFDEDGFTINSGDCDDLNASINPLKQDVCDDGIDQDCNGIDKACDNNSNNIRLRYYVNILSSKKSVVNLNISDISSTKLAMYRIVYDQKYLPNISNLNIISLNKDEIQYELKTTQSGGMCLQELRINNVVSNNISINYELSLSEEADLISKEDLLFMAESQLLFQPILDEIKLDSIYFEFNVPKDWKVVTRLVEKNSGYLSNLNDSHEVIFHTYRPVLFNQFIAFGKYNVIDSSSDNIRILSSYPSSQSGLDEIAETTIRLFRYNQQEIGNFNFNLENLSYAFFLDKENYNISGQIFGTGGTFEILSPDEESNFWHLSHEIIHLWLGCGNSIPRGRKFLLVPCWFQEGTIDFLAVRALHAIGKYTFEQAEEQHIHNFNKYIEYLIDTGNDIPLEICTSEPYPSDTYFGCQYHKAHTMTWLLNEVLKERTNNRVNFKTLVISLFEKFATRPEYSSNVDYIANKYFLSTEDILTEIESITGYQFKKFFDQYITGTEPLPVAYQNNRLVVLWDQLPSLSKY